MGNELCGCEESIALRAENEGLAVEVKQYRLGNENLRELARELRARLRDRPDCACSTCLKARALGVEVGR